jgi:hypothetical protein
LYPWKYALEEKWHTESFIDLNTSSVLICMIDGE